MIVNTLERPYYAVIFTSIRTKDDNGASSFVSTVNKNGSFITGVDLIYEFDKNSIETQGYKIIEKIYF